MRALVTGASGFIGRHLVDRLLAEGCSVRCLARSRFPRPPASAAEVLPCDYQSGAGLRDALAGVDAVFHLAGVTKALRPADYYSGNVTAAANLAQAARDVPVFVHVSSLAAAGPSPPASDLTEDADPHPVSDYGRSKLAGEQAVRRALPLAVILRPPIVYGPRDRDVLQMLRPLARGIDLHIGRAERWFSAIYVADLVEALLAAARSPAARGRLYFVAHPEPVSWSQFAASAARILNRRLRDLTIPSRAAALLVAVSASAARLRGKPSIFSADKLREARHPRWTCATGRARAELGFTAPTAIDAGLALTIAWYKERRWL